MNENTVLPAVARLRAEVPGADDAHLAALRRRIALSADAPGAPRRAGLPPGPVRRGVALVGVAAAVAAGLVLSGTVIPGPGGGPTEAAAATLQRAAVAAGLRAGPESLRPGQYWYSRYRTVVQDGSFAEDDPGLTCLEHERWEGLDGSGRIIGRACAGPRTGAITEEATYGPRGSDHVVRTYSPDGRVSVERDPGEGNVTTLQEWIDELAALPTEAGALAEHLRREAQADVEPSDQPGPPPAAPEAPADVEPSDQPGPPPAAPGAPGTAVDVHQFDRTVAVLTNTAASAPLRRAAFEALARVDGVTVIGPSTDALGRTGTGIAFRANTSATEIIVEQTTGDVLASRHLADGVEWANGVYVVDGPVDSTEQRL